MFTAFHLVGTTDTRCSIVASLTWIDDGNRTSGKHQMSRSAHP